MEEDNDELLQCSDDDSMSESDDQCVPVEKPEDVRPLVYSYTSHSLPEFIATKISLIISSTALLILLPIFQESINIKGDAYSLIYFVSTATVLVLFLIILGLKKFTLFLENVKVSKLPLNLKEIVSISFVYTVSGFCIIYAMDRKRVMCHLQDPIKGLLLVFSLIYYFFFCKKMMGLQRIFSTTTIIVGLFIAVDYGLCNEFRCRGNDREHKSDDAGVWSWQAHSVWSATYIFGLALFSAYFTLLDRFVVGSTLTSLYTSFSSQLLTTVSRIVSFQTSGTPASSQTRSLSTSRTSKKIYSALHLAFWVHVFIWLFTLSFFWTDLLPKVGKSTNMTEFLNHTTSGIICIFSAPELRKSSLANCANTSIYAWLFLIAYLIFTISSTRFLILTQSAVFTIAVATISLPAVGIYWSLFKMTSVQKGLIIWYPTVSGELICALLGLPIIIAGLVLLCKSHFRDCQLSKSGNDLRPSSTQLA